MLHGCQRVLLDHLPPSSSTPPPRTTMQHENKSTYIRSDHSTCTGEQLVFIDEQAAHGDLTQRAQGSHPWANRECTARTQHQPFVKGKRFDMLRALSNAMNADKHEEQK
jgi:hypothetical protein